MAKVKTMSDNREYYCDYELDKELLLDIYDSSLFNANESDIWNADLLLLDIKNSNYFYSPLFIFAGESWGHTYTQKFRADYYFYTKRFESVVDLNRNIKIKAITFFNPMLIHFYTNSSLYINYTEERKSIEYTVLLKDADKHIVTIGTNNIDKIEFGSIVQSKSKNQNLSIAIEAENYVKLYLSKSLGYDDMLSYINEMDMFINAYSPKFLRSYRTTVQCETGNSFELHHKLLSDQKHYNKAIFNPVKNNFFDYLGLMYKSTACHEPNLNRNDYYPLDFKRPTSLEDRFLYFYRYVEMYMYKTNSIGRKDKNKQVIDKLLENHLYLFEPEDTTDKVKLRYLLCSLRNHYTHEGYYLPNNEFVVKLDDGSKYNQTMGYAWLYRITKSLELSVYTILYTCILKLDIDETELKYALRYQ